MCKLYAPRSRPDSANRCSGLFFWRGASLLLVCSSSLQPHSRVLPRIQNSFAIAEERALERLRSLSDLGGLYLLVVGKVLEEVRKMAGNVERQITILRDSVAALRQE